VAALAPAFALGALDPDEHDFLETHRASCTLPHPELREALLIASIFGQSEAVRTRPRPCLRRQVLDAVHAEAVASARAGEPSSKPLS
jgi:hypothetical protein